MSIEMIKSVIRDIPDFPKKGIIFKDITPVLKDGKLFENAVMELSKRIEDDKPDFICGIESRGFIFGAAIAYQLNIGFVPIRKPGKLPYKKYSIKYDLEYGSNVLEIHKDSFFKNANVVIIDDLLATGGTAKASAELVEKCGAKVAKILFLVELSFLNGRGLLKNYLTEAIVSF